jgi:Glucose / Sorbosone dehydrogenase
MVTAQNRTGLAAKIGWIFLALLLAGIPALRAQYPSSSHINKTNGIAILLEDYASVPISTPLVGTYPSPINYHGQLGRVNSLRSEPANAPKSASRFFVIDASAILYILDKNSKTFTPYLNFAELFPRFDSGRGNAAGIVSIAFDPEYAKNGKFYTVHTEDPNKAGSGIPTNAHLAALDVNGYAITPTLNPPAGPACCESVLVEWTDTNIGNSTFEGSAREILRTGTTFTRHQMDDLLFNPVALPGQSDYRNLYISLGDGGGGETPGETHPFPQLLNAVQGKILRITPDLKLRPKDMLGANGRYRVPSTGTDPNPFVSVSGARPEIFAYGLRNPHRFTWDPASNTFLVNDIGLHSWEEINIVTKGSNFGYAEREGGEQLFVGGANDGKTGSQVSPAVSFPGDDLLTVVGIDKPVAPVYPVAVYTHNEGDSLGSGFVYRGKAVPQLTGKYVFNDMTTGRLFYADLREMILTHRERNKTAPVHELTIMYRSPYDSSVQMAVERRMYDIVADAYAHKEGIGHPDGVDSKDGVLPGWAAATGGWRGKVFSPGKPDPYGVAYGGGRADVRVAMGGDGELYVLSKSDGMLRKVTASASSGSKPASGN